MSHRSFPVLVVSAALVCVVVMAGISSFNTHAPGQCQAEADFEAEGERELFLLQRGLVVQKASVQAEEHTGEEQAPNWMKDSSFLMEVHQRVQKMAKEKRASQSK